MPLRESRCEANPRHLSSGRADLSGSYRLAAPSASPLAGRDLACPTPGLRRPSYKGKRRSVGERRGAPTAVGAPRRVAAPPPVNKAIRDAGLQDKRRMNPVDAMGALVPMQVDDFYYALERLSGSRRST